MGALTESRNTLERQINFRRYTLAATVLAGAMTAQNADGNAVPASDTAGLTVIGRCEHSGTEGDDIDVKVGCFRWENSETDAVAAANINKLCYVEDDQTINASGGTNKIVAGVVVEIDDEGVWVDCRPAAIAAALASVTA